MKIKAPSRAHIIKARRKALYQHWWLMPEKPKKLGRLKQLNKHNNRKPSEFVTMAIAIDTDPRNDRRMK